MLHMLIRLFVIAVVGYICGLSVMAYSYGARKAVLFRVVAGLFFILPFVLPLTVFDAVKVLTSKYKMKKSMISKLIIRVMLLVIAVLPVLLNDAFYLMAPILRETRAKRRKPFSFVRDQMREATVRCIEESRLVPA